MMTWWQLRQYVVLETSTSLSNNYISRPHHLTEELLAHAGTIQLLCIYLCFSNTSLDEYSLCHTGDHGLEAIHGTFRGRTCLLPTTSPNLPFQDFLEEMNAAQTSEHQLNKIKGCTIVASKKRTLLKILKRAVALHTLGILYHQRMMPLSYN